MARSNRRTNRVERGEDTHNVYIRSLDRRTKLITVKPNLKFRHLKDEEAKRLNLPFETLFLEFNGHRIRSNSYVDSITTNGNCPIKIRADWTLRNMIMASSKHREIQDKIVKTKRRLRNLEDQLAKWTNFKVEMRKRGGYKHRKRRTEKRDDRHMCQQTTPNPGKGGVKDAAQNLEDRLL